MVSRENHQIIKKPSRSNSNSTIANLLNQNLSQQTTNPSTSSSNTSNEFVPVFFSEISDIMRGFGDASNPIRESVILVEKILLKQLRGIVQDAVDSAMERKGKPNPTQIDFEFLMRKNPIKISRLRKYLRDVKLQKKYEELQNGRTALENIENLDDNSEEELTEDEQEYHDEDKLRRLFRADRISQTLTEEEYNEFNTARRVSFNCRNSSAMRMRLRDWLGVSSDIIFSSKCLTILAYFAHETIATIVDYCILSRLNSGNRATDPYVRVATPGTYFDMIHLCPEVTQGRGMDGAKAITPHEINESIRRFTQTATQSMGNFRNSKPIQQVYLAL